MSIIVLKAYADLQASHEIVRGKIEKVGQNRSKNTGFLYYLGFYGFIRGLKRFTENHFLVS